MLYYIFLFLFQHLQLNNSSVKYNPFYYFHYKLYFIMRIFLANLIIDNIFQIGNYFYYFNFSIISLFNINNISIFISIYNQYILRIQKFKIYSFFCNLFNNKNLKLS